MGRYSSGKRDGGTGLLIPWRAARSSRVSGRGGGGTLPSRWRAFICRRERIQQPQARVRLSRGHGADVHGIAR